MVVWLIIIFILLASTVSYGAYTYFSYTRRVVSTQSSNGIAFSSNLLSLVSSEEDTYATTLFSFSGNSISRMITVCNYPQNNPTEINKNTIKYSFTAEIIKKDESVTVDYSGFNINFENQYYSFTDSVCRIDNIQMRSASEPVTNSFILTAATANLKNISVRITAEPDSESLNNATENRKLARNLTFTDIQNSSHSWEGRFTDQFNNEEDTRNYYGFNYEIYGSGSGTFILKWNTDYIDLDPEFAEKAQISTNGNIRSFTLKVGEDDNGEESANTYRMQFYRTRSLKDVENERYKSYTDKNNNTYYTVVDAGDSSGNVIPYIEYSYTADQRN